MGKGDICDECNSAFSAARPRTSLKTSALTGSLFVQGWTELRTIRVDVCCGNKSNYLWEVTKQRRPLHEAHSALEMKDNALAPKFRMTRVYLSSSVITSHGREPPFVSQRTSTSTLA